MVCLWFMIVVKTETVAKTERVSVFVHHEDVLFILQKVKLLRVELN